MYHLMTCSFFLSLGLCLLPIKSISVSLVAFLYFSFLLQKLSFSPHSFWVSLCRLPSLRFHHCKNVFLVYYFSFIICHTQIPQYVTFERIMGDSQEMKIVLYYILALNMGEVMNYSLTAGRVTVSSYDGGSVSSEGLDMSTC